MGLLAEMKDAMERAKAEYDRVHKEYSQKYKEEDEAHRKYKRLKRDLITAIAEAYGLEEDEL